MSDTHDCGCHGACGCCEPAAPPTPLPLDARPGLPALAYRIGTFASFRQAMVEAIAAQPELAGLRTRASDDFAIALLESWAVVGDVLTFYQERLANETFLRTARERDSVLRLVRLLGYEPRPALAAETQMAFLLEAGKSLEIPAGLRIMSTPGPNEKPQTFETLEAFRADARLNRVPVWPKPVAANPRAAGTTAFSLFPEEVDLARKLKPGQKLVTAADLWPDAAELHEIESLGASGGRFEIKLKKALTTDWPEYAQTFLVGRELRLFGVDAPNPISVALIGGGVGTIQAAFLTLSGEDILLESRYDELRVGDRLLIAEKQRAPYFSTVTGLSVVNAALGTLPADAAHDPRYRATVTAIEADNFGFENFYNVKIYHLLGEALPLWPAAPPEQLTSGPLCVPARLDNGVLEINRQIEGLEVRSGDKLRPEEIELGRSVMLEDGLGRTVAARIVGRRAEKIFGRDFLVLDFAADAPFELDAKSTVLLGNVARAGHGETVRAEILGNGDGTQVFQTFTMARTPLTHLPSATAPGGISSLDLRVDGEAWAQVPSLFGVPGDARVFVSETNDDGTTTLRFGDSATGARLPTGRANVVARYRLGAGLEGRVKAGQLNLLLDRPPGLEAAFNPAAAQGGADPESRDQARVAAPRSVLTFGRAVALEDFAALALESGEVARAHATFVRHGLESSILVTVAGQGGQAFSPAVLARLRSALLASAAPEMPLRLANLCRIPFEIRAKIFVLPTFERAKVEAEVRARLLAAFAFEVRELARPVHASDVHALIHQIQGVDRVDLDRLHFRGVFNFLGQVAWSADNLAARGATPARVQNHLRFFGARAITGSAQDDLLVAACFPAGLPQVLPAEQPWLEVPSRDLRLSFLGGLS